MTDFNLIDEKSGETIEPMDLGRHGVLLMTQGARAVLSAWYAGAPPEVQQEVRALARGAGERIEFVVTGGLRGQRLELVATIYGPDGDVAHRIAHAYESQEPIQRH